MMFRRAPLAVMLIHVIMMNSVLVETLPPVVSNSKPTTALPALPDVYTKKSDHKKPHGNTKVDLPPSPVVVRSGFLRGTGGGDKIYENPGENVTLNVLQSPRPVIMLGGLIEKVLLPIDTTRSLVSPTANSKTLLPPVSSTQPPKPLITDYPRSKNSSTIAMTNSNKLQHQELTTVQKQQELQNQQKKIEDENKLKAQTKLPDSQQQKQQTLARGLQRKQYEQQQELQKQQLQQQQELQKQQQQQLLKQQQQQQKLQQQQQQQQQQQEQQQQQYAVEDPQATQIEVKRKGKGSGGRYSDGSKDTAVVLADTSSSKKGGPKGATAIPPKLIPLVPLSGSAIKNPPPMTPQPPLPTTISFTTPRPYYTKPLTAIPRQYEEIANVKKPTHSLQPNYDQSYISLLVPTGPPTPYTVGTVTSTTTTTRRPESTTTPNANLRYTIDVNHSMLTLPPYYDQSYLGSILSVGPRTIYTTPATTEANTEQERFADNRNTFTDTLKDPTTSLPDVELAQEQPDDVKGNSDESRPILVENTFD